MSTKKEIWRLLEPMDAGEDGDQWSSDGLIWRDIDKNTPLLTIKFRRRLVTLPEPQGWISVKERMPTKEDAGSSGCVIWARKDGGIYREYWDTRMGPFPDYWMPIPPFPDKDLDEEAFREWLNQEEQRHFWGAEGHEVCKLAFLAGRKSVTTEKEEK